jgi:SnoaL-like domain
MATDDAALALMRATLLDVFGERDPARRRAAIERTYADDVTFSDEDATVVGHDALDARVAELQARLPPDAVFAPDSPVYAGAGGEHALAWTLSPEGGAPVARGLDVATIADGRIAALRTLLAG